MSTRCRAKSRGGRREGCLSLSGGSPLGGADGGPPPAALSPPFLLQAGPLCPEVTRVRCGCREPQATGYPPTSSAPGPEGLHGGRSQQQKSAGPQEAQETPGVCPGWGALLGVSLLAGSFRCECPSPSSTERPAPDLGHGVGPGSRSRGGGEAPLC